MAVKPGLSDYAKGHLLMVDISKRFEAVIARNPQYTSDYKRWRVDEARKRGRQQIRDYPNDLTLIEYYAREK